MQDVPSPSSTFSGWHLGSAPDEPENAYNNTIHDINNRTLGVRARNPTPRLRKSRHPSTQIQNGCLCFIDTR